MESLSLTLVQTVIYHTDDKQWWITVTFRGEFPYLDPEHIKLCPDRREEFRNFIMTIDFQSHAFLDDTVTELIVEKQTTATEDIKDDNNQQEKRQNDQLKGLQFSVRENPLRVTYPPASQFPNCRAIQLEEIIEENELCPSGVYLVMHKGDNKKYVLNVRQSSFVLPNGLRRHTKGNYEPRSIQRCRRDSSTGWYSGGSQPVHDPSTMSQSTDGREWHCVGILQWWFFEKCSR